MTGAPGSPRPAAWGGRLRAALGPSGALAELWRFSLVGVVTALLDLGVYNGALLAFGTRATPAVLLSSTLAFFASMLTSYVGNRRFTFRDRGGEGRLLPYAAVSLSGFFIENASLYLVWQVFVAAGVAHGLIVANIARAAAAVPALAWTFLLYRSVVFVPEGRTLAPTAVPTRLPGAVHRLLYDQPLLPLAGLLAVGIALRLPFLLSLPLSAGEWQAAHTADLLVSGRPVGGAPSLMGIVLAALFRITGPSFSEPRVAAVILSAAAVAATFFLGRALWRSTVAGLLAALVVAANGPSILASHIAVSSVAGPLVASAAAYATVRGTDGDARLLVLGAALWLTSLATGAWGYALVPGVALALAGGLGVAPVPMRPAIARLGGVLALVLATILVLLGRPVWPGHLFVAVTALVRTAGDLALVPAAIQPVLGAAVLASIVAVLAYGLRSRRGRVVALPLLGALVGGPFLVAPNSGGAVTLLPLFAVLAAGAARWGARRLARHVPTPVFAAVAALTAAVIGFLPLLGLGAHYGHLLQADRAAVPSPQILRALARVGATPKSRMPVLLDSRGFRAGVVGWVLALNGYRVTFVGNPYRSAAGATSGASLRRAVLGAAGPTQPAAFVITRADYGVLANADPDAEIISRLGGAVAGGYIVGTLAPPRPPLAAPAGAITWAPGEGPAGIGVGAGADE